MRVLQAMAAESAMPDAAGRLDVYWATSVSAWDIAAGALIVQEAGGIVTGLDGGPLDLERPELTASASQPLHDEVMRLLALASHVHESL